MCSIIYAGTEAFSEPESQNIRDLVEDNAPRIILYISTHTYGGYMLYPFSSSTWVISEISLQESVNLTIFLLSLVQPFLRTTRNKIK